MKRLALAAALVALAGIAWLLLHGGADERGGGAAPLAEPASQEQIEPASTESADSARAELEEQPNPAPAPLEPSSAPAADALPTLPQRVIGRCLSEGVPQVGVEVVLTSVEHPSREQTRRTARTDALGRFAIDATVRGNTQHLFHCTATGLATRTATLGPSSTEPVIDLGDIEMPRAFALHGFVTTPEGRPIFKAVVLARSTAEFAQDLEFGRLGQITAFTDETGRYEFTSLPIAEWELSVSRKGLAQSSTALARALDSSPLRVDLVATEVPSVSGRAIDERGEPVAKLALKLVDASNGHDQAWRVPTDASGAFELELVPKGEPATELKLVIEAGSDYAAEPLPCRWGDRDLSFVVRAQPAARVRLVARDTGRVIEHYRYRQAASPALDGVVRDALVEDGWARFSLRSPERPYFWIFPPTPYELAGPIDLSPYARQDQPLELVVERARMQRIRVRDRRGASVEGAEARILSVAAGTDLRAPGFLAAGDEGGLLWPGVKAWLWDRALTDAHGRAELRLPPLDSVELHVRLQLHGGGEQLARLDVRDQEREREIVVAIRGTAVQLRFEGEWPRGARIQLVDPANASALPVPLSFGIVASGGEEKLVPVPYAGEWTLRMRVHEGECELARVRVEDGETTELVLDVADVFLPSAALPVRLDGAPLTSGSLSFALRSANGAQPRMLSLALSAESTELPRLPVGSYSVVHEETGASAPFDRAVLESGVLELR